MPNTEQTGHLVKRRLSSLLGKTAPVEARNGPEDGSPLLISNQESHTNTDTPLQRYYASPESRIGYRLVLGGTRHMGFYDHDSYWPFPINKALRAMEDHLFHSLGLSAGARVLDAGCGVGHVAIHMARKGLRVQGIDLVDRHVAGALKNIRKEGLEKVVHVRAMDYHHPEFEDDSYDGLYTMETFVHSTDPERALEEFCRVLRPGGRIALYEYDHTKTQNASYEKLNVALDHINILAAMPANARFEQGVLERMLEDTGFEDVKVEDLSVNVKPMARLFFVVAYIPYLLFTLLGIHFWFVNTMAGVEGYRALNRGLWRYTAITARKPLKSLHN